MQNYVKNSVRTLFAGLFLMIGSLYADDVAVAPQAVNAQSNTSSLDIFVQAIKRNTSDIQIFAYPSVYALTSEQAVVLGAPKPGYYASSLVRIAQGYGAVALVNKKVIMNGATGQANPLYNKHITHVCPGYQSCVYAVTEDTPDTVYRYASYEKGESAQIHSHKITDPDGKPCTIKGITWGVLNGAEYIIAQVRSVDSSKGTSLAFIKSYTKLIPAPAKPKLSLEEKQEAAKKKAKEDRFKSEEEVEAEKRAEEEKSKPTQRYMFTGFNPLDGTEEVCSALPLEALIDETVKNGASYQVTDIQILYNTLYVELCVQGSTKRMLLQAAVAKQKFALKPVGKGTLYHRQVAKRQSWECEPSMNIFTLPAAQKKYALLIGDTQKPHYSYKQLFAMPLDKDAQEVALVIGGSVELPGPISDVKTEGETVFVSVATPDTDMLPGIFQSQAIIDAQQVVAGWTPWQRVAGSIDAVVSINPSGLGMLSLSCDPSDYRLLNFYANKWRGSSVEKAEEKAREEARIKREEARKEAEAKAKTLAALKAEAEKNAAKSGQAPEVKKKKANPAEPNFDPIVVGNSYFDVDSTLIKRQSSTLQLSYRLEELFAQETGGVRSMCDVPATSASPASFVVAVGYQQVVIAQLNQQLDAAKNKIIRTYTHNVVCTDGTCNALLARQKDTEAIVCSGGVLQELSYLDFVHMATNGSDTWLIVAGPLGVAILRDESGKGLQAKTGFGDQFSGVNPQLAFKRLGSYQWIRAITSDDQFVYIVTEDRIDRIPLQRSSFVESSTVPACTIATGDIIGGVCDGYVFNDVCVSQGMMFVATPCGLAATTLECDCRTVTQADQLSWQRVEIPAATPNIARLVPVSPTGLVQDVACKGQLYVVASSLFDETASVTRLFIDKENKKSPISVVPDVMHNKAGSWLNYVHQITAFFTDGINHLVARSRFEERTVDLARVPAAGAKRNSGTSQIAFSQDTLQVSGIMRTSATGTLFVTADDGVRIYE